MSDEDFSALNNPPQQASRPWAGLENPAQPWASKVSIPWLEQPQDIELHEAVAKRDWNVPRNVAIGVGNIAQGIGAMAALPLMRGYEVATGEMNPEGLQQFGKDLTNDPWQALAKKHLGTFFGNEKYGQPGIYRGTDLPQLGEAGRGIASHYWNDWIKPASARNASVDPSVAAYYAEHVAKDPLSILDVGGGALLAKAGKGIAAKLPLVQKAMEAHGVRVGLHDLIKDMDYERLSALLKANEEMDKANKALEAAGITEAQFTTFATRSDPSMIRKLADNPVAVSALNTLKRWGDEVARIVKPMESTQTVTKYGEAYLTKQERMRKGTIKARAKEYKVATEAMKNPSFVAQHATSRSAKSPETLKRQIQGLSRRLQFEDLYPGALGGTGAHFTAVSKEAKALGAAVQSGPGLNSRAYLPAYVPIIGKGAAKHIAEQGLHEPFGGYIKGRLRMAADLEEQGASILENPPKGTPGAFFKRKKSFARTHPEQTIPEETLPSGTAPTIDPATGLPIPRLPGAGYPDFSKGTVQSVRLAGFHEMNAMKAMKARLAEVKAVEMYQKIFKELGKYQKARPGWTQIDLGESLGEIAPEFGLGPDEVRRMVGGLTPQNRQIYLPPGAAKYLKRMLNRGKKVDMGLIGEAYKKAGRLYTTGLFGLDPMFEVMMAVRTGVLQAWMVRSPKEALGMVIATKLAKRPEAEHHFFAELLKSHAGGHLDPNLMTEISATTHPNPVIRASAQMWRAMQKAMIAKSEKGYGVHNDQRRAALIFNLLYASDKAPPTVKRLIADMMKAESALQRAVKRSNDPVQLKAAVQKLTAVMGDYSKLSYENQQWVQLVFPIWAWVRHAGNLALTLPVEYPAKVALVNAANRLPGQLQADERGNLPLRDLKGNIKVDEQGLNRYMYQPSTDPLKAGFELFADVPELVGMATAWIPFMPDWMKPAGKGLRVPSAFHPVLQGAMEATSGVDLPSGRTFAEEHPFYDKTGKKTTGEYVKKVWLEKEKKFVYREHHFNTDKQAWETKDYDTAGYVPPMYVLMREFPKQTHAVQDVIQFFKDQQMRSPFTSFGEKSPGKTRHGRRGSVTPVKVSALDVLTGMFGVSVHGKKE